MTGIYYHLSPVFFLYAYLPSTLLYTLLLPLSFRQQQLLFASGKQALLCIYVVHHSDVIEMKFNAKSVRIRGSIAAMSNASHHNSVAE